MKEFSANHDGFWVATNVIVKSSVVSCTADEASVTSTQTGLDSFASQTPSGTGITGGIVSGHEPFTTRTKKFDVLLEEAVTVACTVPSRATSTSSVIRSPGSIRVQSPARA